MTDVPDTFRAFVAEQAGDDVKRGLRDLSAGDLPDGDVTVRVSWSSVNYKDALATVPDGKVARISPLVPGIDLAGDVVHAEADGVDVGDEVIVHGYGLGVSHHGGFAEYARVPSGWVVPLPKGMTAREAMALGTAGFTAGMSIDQLEQRGLRPGNGRVLVTGATGGVGSTAVTMLAQRGYEVVASTGKEEAHEWLRDLGASDVVDRAAVSSDGGRPLESQRWAAAVDCVGGATLAAILSSLRIGGAVAATGNAGGAKVETTVLPFILRGVALLGMDSVNLPLDRRTRLWERLASDLRVRGLEESIAREVGLDDLDETLATLLSGAMRGRNVVRVSG